MTPWLLQTAVTPDMTFLFKSLKPFTKWYTLLRD